MLGTDFHSLPECTRSTGARHWAIKNLATPDSVLSEARKATPYDPVAGILPFVAVDHLSTAVRLVARRLALSPELASYHAGRLGAYQTRRQYLFDTIRRVATAAWLLACGRYRRQPCPEPLPQLAFPVITEERPEASQRISA